MNRFLRITSLCATIILLLAVSGCKRESGCTDPNASNYNPNANIDNGTCQYASGAVFYTDVALYNTATVTVSGLNPSTATITGYYTGTSTPDCNASGLASFSTTLSQASVTPSYTYSVALPGSSGWSGTVTLSQATCTPVLLSAGSITFYTTNPNYASNLPINVTINGVTGSITAISNGSPQCQANGCANFGLPLGNYSYSAVTTPSLAGSWSGSVSVTTDGQCNLVQLN